MFKSISHDEILKTMPMDEFLFLTHLCNLSYKTPSELADIFNIYGLTYIFVENKDTDAQCYIFYNTFKIYICFRGTSSKKDVMIDLRVAQSSFIDEDVKVHSGFLEQYLSLKPLLLHHLNNIGRYYKEIVVCGHSLGAGLATIAAVDLSIEIPKEYKCFTIGSPRVGNKCFRTLFNSRIKTNHRLVNSDDPIQYVPMSTYYHHVGEALCFNKKNKLKIKMNNIPFRHRLCNALKNIDLVDIADGHRVDTYADKISKLLQCNH